MILQQRNWTAGDKRKFTVDYSGWLDEGVTVSGFTVTSNTTDVVISGVVKNPTGTCSFFVSGGTVGETATVSLQMTDTRTEVKNDTLVLTIVAP